MRKVLEKERWLEAQNREIEYQKNIFKVFEKKEGDEAVKIMLKGIWNVDYEEIKNKNILDIGIGTRSPMYFIKSKIFVAIEPLDVSKIIEPWKRSIVFRGVGEHLPFKENSFDLTISINVLDHIVRPDLFISECSRVLKDGGIFLLHVHVLNEKFWIFRKILNKLDKPHPHHFTRNELIDMLMKKFNETENEHNLGGITTEKNLLLKGKFKLLLGNIMMDEIYLIVKK